LETHNHLTNNPLMREDVVILETGPDMLELEKGGECGRNSFKRNGGEVVRI